MAGLSSGASAGDVLGLIASGEARTRTDLARHTGLSRATVTERLEVLFRAELISEGDEAPSTGGRPSRTLALNVSRRVILAADVGEDHTRLLLTDLSGAVLAERVESLEVGTGAEAVTNRIAAVGRELVAAADRRVDDLVGIGLSVPAPVDHSRGQVAAPSVMTGWEGVAIETLLRRHLDVPVVVENDVNARGYAEYLDAWRDRGEVLYVKAGTGIGSAIISGGRLFRGARGAAGDIGHIRLQPDGGPLCRCGATGCVEALAAGWSIVRDLDRAAHRVRDTREAVDLVTAGVPEAVHLLREAGKVLGQAIAYAVNLLNPDLIVVGGSLAHAGPHLLSGVRESVYSYSLPLATARLQIVAGRPGELWGGIGVAQLVIGQVLRPDQVNAHLRDLAS